MEPQKIPDNKAILIVNKARGITVSDFQTLLQSYSNQNSMVLLAKKETKTRRPME